MLTKTLFGVKSVSHSAGVADDEHEIEGFISQLDERRWGQDDARLVAGEPPQAALDDLRPLGVAFDAQHAGASPGEPEGGPRRMRSLSVMKGAPSVGLRQRG